MTIRCIRCRKEFDASAKVCPNCGEPLTDFLRKYLREPIDGKYEILERLGVGGMGEVYKVRHTFLGAIRVVKVIRANISENVDGKERFLREARLATRVQHPNVATLHDFSALPDGSQYMVWEYIDGENLAQRIKTFGRLAPRQAVRIAIQTLHGLEAIHRAGIVHRDISPENIMLTREDDRVKIIDLGVAKAEGDGSTQAGMFIGKLRYASPEHLGLLPDGQRIDGRADLYSLAVVLYEMLSGRPPFEATSPHDYLLMHSRETVFKPLDLPAELPGSTDLQGVMKRALERDREQRYSTAADFASVLEAVERTLPDPLDSTIATTSAVTTVQEVPAKVETAPYRKTEPEAPLKAPPTVMDRNPNPAPSKKPMSLAALGTIMGVLVLAIIAMLFVLLRSSKSDEKIAEAKPPVVTTSSASTTQVEVTPPVTTSTEAAVATDTTTSTTATTDTATATTTVEPTTTTQEVAPPPPPPPPTQTVAPKRETKKPKRPTPAPTPAPVPVTPAPAPAPAPITVVRFTEGGDSDQNDAAIAATRRELGSVSQIAIRGSGDAEQTTKLVNIVKGQVGVSDSASVVVNFEGRLERRGFGRKTRSATATISKNGQVVLRYELPSQNYRTGDDPAEAFGRVLLAALGR